MELLGDISIYLVTALVLISCAAFFSGTEVAMFSLRRIEREQLTRSGKKADALVLRMLKQPRRLIATVLIGNESVNVSVSAVLAGMTAVMFPSMGEIGLALIATAITLPLLLFVGEITPKSIAFKMPLSWARTAVRPLWLFSLLATPLRLVVHFFAEVILRLLGQGGKHKPVEADLSPDEFRSLVDAGSAEGQVDARERRLIHRVFEFGGKNVGQIMTPRDKIFALSYELPMTRLIKEVADRGFSRVPIYSKSLDNIRGILNARDLVLGGAGLGRPPPLAELLHEALFVPRTIPVKRLFRTFKQRKVHVAMVVNEYGKLIGIVTMEDVLEQLFGEIRDERETLKAGPRRSVGRRGDRTPVPGLGVIETSPVPKVVLDEPSAATATGAMLAKVATNEIAAAAGPVLAAEPGDAPPPRRHRTSTRHRLRSTDALQAITGDDPRRSSSSVPAAPSSSSSPGEVPARGAARGGGPADGPADGSADGPVDGDEEPE